MYYYSRAFTASKRLGNFLTCKHSLRCNVRQSSDEAKMQFSTKRCQHNVVKQKKRCQYKDGNMMQYKPVPENGKVKRKEICVDTKIETIN
jgi:hypothetical protein